MMIAPSILNINNLDLKNDIQVTAQAGIKRFHIDIMDGHFVPNLSFGPQVVSDFKKTFPKLEAEVHLMSNKPEIMVPAFVKAEADLMLLHYEAMDTAELNKWIDYLKQHQVRVGLVLNPDTPLTVLPPFIPKIDQLLIMTVYPGFGGQKFIAESCEKIRQAKVMLASKIPVEVDGGINRQTAKLAQEAGAEIFVAGSYLFCQESVVAQINELNRVLK